MDHSRKSCKYRSTIQEFSYLFSHVMVNGLLKFWFKLLWSYFHNGFGSLITGVFVLFCCFMKEVLMPLWGLRRNDSHTMLISMVVYPCIEDLFLRTTTTFDEIMKWDALIYWDRSQFSDLTRLSNLLWLTESRETFFFRG